MIQQKNSNYKVVPGFKNYLVNIQQNDEGKNGLINAKSKKNIKGTKAYKKYMFTLKNKKEKIALPFKRIKMMAHLKRVLSIEEVIKHKNGNISDTSIDNMYIEIDEKLLDFFSNINHNTNMDKYFHRVPNDCSLFGFEKKDNLWIKSKKIQKNQIFLKTPKKPKFNLDHYDEAEEFRYEVLDREFPALRKKLKTQQNQNLF